MNSSAPSPPSADVRERFLHLLGKALGHELPNQLIAIQGLARVIDLEERERLSDDGREYLDRLLSAAQRTHELVRSLAEVVKASRPAAAVQPASVAQTLREALALVGAAAGAVENQLPAEALLVQVPGSALRQALIQLLRNACQAGLPDQPLRIEVGAQETADGVALWVRDHGCGIDALKLPKLFEPFAVREGNRPGIGLQLVRQIVEQHGGTMEVLSPPGQGTTVTLNLPRG